MCDEDPENWGPNGWQKIVVCIVADGRSKINDNVLTTIGFMGAFNEKVMKNKINDKDVQAHVFE